MKGLLASLQREVDIAERMWRAGRTDDAITSLFMLDSASPRLSWMAQKLIRDMTEARRRWRELEEQGEE